MGNLPTANSIFLTIYGIFGGGSLQRIKGRERYACGP
jgi:hypothetical protein